MDCEITWLLMFNFVLTGFDKAAEDYGAYDRLNWPTKKIHYKLIILSFSLDSWNKKLNITCKCSSLSSFVTMFISSNET